MDSTFGHYMQFPFSSKGKKETKQTWLQNTYQHLQVCCHIQEILSALD